MEAIIAIPVVTMFFFTLWEITEFYTCKLIVDHAAARAARAAAVVGPDDPMWYDSQKVDDIESSPDKEPADNQFRQLDVLDAAYLVIGSSSLLSMGLVSLDTKVQRGSATAAGADIVTVTVHAEFPCWFPYVSLICQEDYMPVVGKASFVYQSATFEHW